MNKFKTEIQPEFTLTWILYRTENKKYFCKTLFCRYKPLLHFKFFCFLINTIENLLSYYIYIIGIIASLSYSIKSSFILQNVCNFAEDNLINQ